jgi:hypothetical protein
VVRADREHGWVQAETVHDARDRRPRLRQSSWYRRDVPETLCGRLSISDKPTGCVCRQELDSGASTNSSGSSLDTRKAATGRELVQASHSEGAGPPDPSAYLGRRWLLGPWLPRATCMQGLLRPRHRRPDRSGVSTKSSGLRWRRWVRSCGAGFNERQSFRHAIQRQGSLTEPGMLCRSQKISRPGPRRNHRGCQSDEICHDEYPHH